MTFDIAVFEKLLLLAGDINQLGGIFKSLHPGDRFGKFPLSPGDQKRRSSVDSTRRNDRRLQNYPC